MVWQLAEREFSSRLIMGTAHFPSPDIMREAVGISKTDMVTVALKRQSTLVSNKNTFWEFLKTLNVFILPNTAGCKTAREAIMVAQMARDMFNTSWIKLEVIGDDYNLQPDPFELVIAARQLVKQGFTVLPYCTDDFILAQRLLEAGCVALMPWAAPIGTGLGPLNVYALQTLRQRLPCVSLIIDAGIGKPSHAVQLMEMGFDAVLVNSAIARAVHPVQMADAFRRATEAGRLAYKAGLIPAQNNAQPSTPLIDTPFWHHHSQQQES